MKNQYASEKENLAHYTAHSIPFRQGKAFKIKLGLNNGPFLSQDIMHSNEKSLHLLAAREILQSQISMSHLINLIEKEKLVQNKTIRSSCNQVSNFLSKCDYLESQLICLGEESRKLKNEQKNLKVSIKESFRAINAQNEELIENCLPVLKNFARIIRDHSTAEKNLFQERKREIQDLNKFRNEFLNQIILCEERIMKIQEFLGVQDGQNRSAHEPIEEESEFFEFDGVKQRNLKKKNYKFDDRN